MKANSYISLIILSLCLSSCLDLNDGFQSKLHIESIVTNDEVFEVTIRYSQSVEQDFNANPIVEDALVGVINNDTREIANLYHMGDGRYRSAVKPIAGYDYELQVFTDEYGDAFATTYVPSLESITNIEVMDPTQEDEMVTVSFDLDIEVGYENLIAWEFVALESAPEIGEPVVNANAVFIPEEFPDLNPVSQDNISEEGTVTVSSSKVNLGEQEDISIAQVEKIGIRVVAVSTDYYNYLMKDKDENINHSSITSGTYSRGNIINATGVFGAYSERTISLKD